MTPRPRDIIVRPVVSEKSYAVVRRQRLHVRRGARREQDRDPQGGRGDLQRPRHQREHDQPQGQAQAQPALRHLVGPSRSAPRHRVTRRRRPHRNLRELTVAVFASASPRAPVAGSRASPTSPTSRPTSPRSRSPRRCTSTGGRNSYGRKTAASPRWRAQALYRIIDFKREKDGVPAKVASVEYDPNRNARIALLHYRDGADAGRRLCRCDCSFVDVRDVRFNAQALGWTPVRCICGTRYSQLVRRRRVAGASSSG